MRQPRRHAPKPSRPRAAGTLWFAASLWLALAQWGGAGRCGAWEADCRACDYCRASGDIAAKIDARIRRHLATGGSVREIALAEGGTSLLRSPIETWAKSLPEAVRPNRALLRYRGSGLPDSPLLSAYSPSVKVKGVCIGTDKLAHLFQQGWEYYSIAVLDGKGEALAERYGEWLEGKEPRASYSRDEPYFLTQPSGRVLGYGSFGRTTSGVISHADLAANRSGLRMYGDLARGSFTSISNYVSSALCEEVNPNTYTPEMQRIVDHNEREWQRAHVPKP
ncbi:MAG TPA: hypothetical protein DCM86_17090 [Verrucomicrobiales bacterium]|nr:hypothetical protein [Verrucomicrobiales bacterium]